MSIKLLFSLLLIALVVPLIFISCYPDGGLTASDYDVVVTVYDNEFKFGAVKTYALPDTVLHLLPDSTIDDSISRDYDELILSKVVENMDKIGYTRITDIDTTDPGKTPDVVMLVKVSVTNWKGWSYYPGWWGNWGYWPGWGWWGPGYPGYGPGYPGVAVPYTFNTGTIFIEMYDPHNTDWTEGTIPVPWGAGLNGLLTGSSGGTRISQAIDQAFNQSPYLGTQ